MRVRKKGQQERSGEEEQKGGRKVKKRWSRREYLRQERVGVRRGKKEGKGKKKGESRGEERRRREIGITIATTVFL